jgi:sec-independent protein translocase protein TatA
MGALSPWHIIIIVVLLLLIFGGGGKLSGLMGDAAKGVKAFKDGLKDEDKPDAQNQAKTETAQAEALPPAAESKKPRAPRKAKTEA